MAGMNNYTTMKHATNKARNNESDADKDVLSQQTATTVLSKERPTSLPKQLEIDTMDDEDLQGSYLESINLSPDALASMKYISDRDLMLSFEKPRVVDKYYINPDEEITELTMRRYLGIGVQWVSLLTENLLSHPFIVLRRQCQVYNASNYYHLHPLYLIPSVIHLHRRQGVTTLWKGLGSCLLVRGTSMAVEDIISKLTTWPKEVDSRTTLKRFGQHILLKCISITLVMPFYAASLVETVQSDIASEKPGILDVFREGSLRLLYWSSPQKGRMLPIWALTAPTVAIGISRYLLSLVIKGISSRLIRRRLQQTQEKQGAKYKDTALEHQNVEVYSNLLSMLLTEAIFFPFETIIHRLQLQGTRTIIDNLDNGYAVVPILTNYQGAIDCYRTTIATEGVAGLYKGFGALILQFAAHVAVIKLTKWTVSQLSEIISNRPSSKVIQYYNLDRGMISNSTTISPSLSLGSDLNEHLRPTSTPIIQETL